MKFSIYIWVIVVCDFLFYCQVLRLAPSQVQRPPIATGARLISAVANSDKDVVKKLNEIAALIDSADLRVVLETLDLVSALPGETGAGACGALVDLLRAPRVLRDTSLLEQSLRVVKMLQKKNERALIRFRCKEGE